MLDISTSIYTYMKYYFITICNLQLNFIYIKKLVIIYVNFISLLLVNFCKNHKIQICHKSNQKLAFYSICFLIPCKKLHIFMHLKVILIFYQFVQSEG